MEDLKDLISPGEIKKLIYRNSPPSKLDTSDYKTVCIVSDNQISLTSDSTFYIQLNQDAENPRWEKVDREQLQSLDS